MADPEDKVKLH